MTAFTFPLYQGYTGEPASFSPTRRVREKQVRWTSMQGSREVVQEEKGLNHLASRCTLGGGDWVSPSHTKIETDLKLSRIWMTTPGSASDALLAGWGVTREVKSLGGCDSSVPGVLMGMLVVLTSLTASLRQMPELGCVWVCNSRSQESLH